MNVNFTKDTTNAFLTEGLLDEADLAITADKVKEQPKFLHKKVWEQKMKLVLRTKKIKNQDNDYEEKQLVGNGWKFAKMEGD